VRQWARGNWPLMLHLGIAATLVRMAYVHALFTLEPELSESLSSNELTLLEILNEKDIKSVFDIEEDEVTALLVAVFDSDPTVQKCISQKKDSLARAFCSFLQSEAYLAVTAMTRQQNRIWAARKKLERLKKENEARKADRGD